MKLPASIQVIERGWLSSNNIVFRGARATALVDSGYVTHAPQTLALLERALEGAALDWLVNTHCHSDHMGGNRAIQDRYACRTSIPAGEAKLVEAWDEKQLMLGFADQRAERFRIDDVFEAGAVLELGDIDWQAIASPGHDANAVMLYAPEERILISADALWENGFGVIFPQMFGRETAFAETRATLESIARLEPRLVIPGHGRMFTEVGAALERAFARLSSYEASIERLARHCLKVLLVFALLDKGSMPLAGLPAYVQSIGVYTDLNARYLRMTPQALAEFLVADLEKAGAAKRENGMLVPLIAA
ncbi:MAG: MBL fold metallo-hydrolase [Betaproteobacteria bacterium]|nr:MBL fold metallo-hydrolase [Betaproteobacteria bacterium]